MSSSIYSLRSVAMLPPKQQRWALAGLVLAMVLLALLVSVMNENVTQAKSTREIAEQKMQERGRCNVLRDRRERDQCFLDLRLMEPTPVVPR